MKDCKKSQKWMTDILFGESDALIQENLNRHMEQCPECRETFGRYRNTLKIMEDYRRPEPDEAYWTAYWNKLETKLPEKQPSLWAKIRSRASNSLHLEIGFSTTPRLVISAALILVIGIYIGQSTFTPSSGPGVKQTLSQAGLSPELFHQTSNYIEHSKLILLGIVNSEQDSDDLFENNFSRQQNMSRQLINQTGSLKSDLESQKQHMLVELVTELEVILMQIANLEAEGNLDGVDLIRDGATSNSILFKINLGELLLSRPQQSAKTPKQPLETT